MALARSARVRSARLGWSDSDVNPEGSGSHGNGTALHDRLDAVTNIRTADVRDLPPLPLGEHYALHYAERLPTDFPGFQIVSPMLSDHLLEPEPGRTTATGLPCGCRRHREPEAAKRLVPVQLAGCPGPQVIDHRFGQLERRQLASIPMLPAVDMSNAATETRGAARQERPTKFKADQIILLRRASRCHTGKRFSNSAE